MLRYTDNLNGALVSADQYLAALLLFMRGGSVASKLVPSCCLVAPVALGWTMLRRFTEISLALCLLVLTEDMLGQQVANVQPSGGKMKTVLAVQEGPSQVVQFPLSSASDRISLAVHEKPHEIELTPDGKTAFVSNFGLLEVNHKMGTPGTTISVLDVRKGTVRTEFKLPEGYRAPHGLKLRPHWNELFTNAEDGNQSMVVFNTKTGGVTRTFHLPDGVHNFIFTPDGSSLYAFTTANSVIRINPDSGDVMNTAVVRSPRGLAWTFDAKHLIVGGKDELLLLDPTSLNLEARWSNLGVGQIFYPLSSSDGKWIFAPAVIEGVVLVIDAVKGTVAHRVQTGSPLLAVQDGNSLWVSNVLVPPAMLPKDAAKRMGGIVVVNLTTFEPTPIPGLEDTNGIALSSVAISKR
jgi:DNA-binding beta-propeller fold protein YncE